MASPSPSPSPSPDSRRRKDAQSAAFGALPEEANHYAQLRHFGFVWSAGIVAFALITWACIALGIDESAAKCIYLTAIVFLSLIDSFVSSVVFCVIAVFCLDYFFGQPPFTLRVPSAGHLPDLLTFLAASLVITALVRHTHKLGRAQREQASLLDLTHDTIVVRDTGGAITYWNRGAQRLYGWEKDEVLGKPLHELLKTHFPVQLQQIVDTLGATGHWEGELVCTTRDGAERVIASRWSLQRGADGEPVATLESGTDITDRKRAEDALRRSEATYLAEAQKLSATGSFGWDIESGRVFWSEQSFRIFGYETDIEPTLDRVIQRIHPDDINFVHDLVEHASSGRHSLDFEHRLLMPDGTTKYLHVVAHAIEADRLRYAGAIMDITAARQTELRLQDAQAELARITRLTMLGELSASIAHEVGQPLSATVTSAEASLRWLDRDPPRLDEVKSGLTRIISEAQRSFQIVRRVRTLAQKNPVQKAAIDVNEIVNESVALIQREIFRHRVPLQLKLAHDLPLVFADRIQLQQVVINLAMNGIQALDGMIDRPRELSIETRTGPARDDPVVIAVKDNGAGISRENEARLFEAFFTTKPQGTGIGLSICRSIIEAHHGTIRASNNDGYGATFECALPRASADSVDEFSRAGSPA
ncbi:PAS domain-containing sensor histidine kinase [Paraburkholderia rhizosphaerae]|uniref:histidine kinase n=1 Tax=Paraburkholderia rhizosphaerae TaxID=480658 RepID=A0A4R8LUN7_9BURK|nr:PAS domain-containing sensor histidine kinase [Paraburkholderia rhizosphaerae]TDY51493.1 PAS domain S-box-containing protein [Paraburkholderia rhizosphaerae]